MVNSVFNYLMYVDGATELYKIKNSNFRYIKAYDCERHQNHDIKKSKKRQIIAGSPVALVVGYR